MVIIMFPCQCTFFTPISRQVTMNYFNDQILSSDHGTRKSFIFSVEQIAHIAYICFYFLLIE